MVRTLGGRDACLRMAAAFLCPPETVTILLISYNPIQNKKLKKKERKNPGSGEQQGVCASTVRPRAVSGCRHTVSVLWPKGPRTCVSTARPTPPGGLPLMVSATWRVAFYPGLPWSHASWVSHCMPASGVSLWLSATLWMSPCQASFPQVPWARQLPVNWWEKCVIQGFGSPLLFLA